MTKTYHYDCTTDSSMAKVVVTPLYKGGHKIEFYHKTKKSGEKCFYDQNAFAYRSTVKLYYKSKSGKTWNKVKEEINCSVYDWLN